MGNVRNFTAFAALLTVQLVGESKRPVEPFRIGHVRRAYAPRRAGLGRVTFSTGSANNACTLSSMACTPNGFCK